MCLSFAMSTYPRETLTVTFFAAGILVTRFAGEEFEAWNLDVSTCHSMQPTGHGVTFLGLATSAGHAQM